ncbi:hypothetical protein N0V82_006052 [Gnomoniopsis sp. IMI 355080]|nr:hypothetical protein N0V82_006052 [Gnomoniopsis sp. IMI 355080]
MATDVCITEADRNVEAGTETGRHTVTPMLVEEDVALARRSRTYWCAAGGGCLGNRGGVIVDARDVVGVVQDWVFGPPGRNANWRDTPWSSGANSGLNAHNLATGAIVEEIGEGGILPAVSALTDRTHNHYHIGSNGRSRRSSRRRGLRDCMWDHGILGLVNRERDRELDRNMVNRQAADRERDREFDQDMVDRDIAKQRDQHLLALLDRERERQLNGAMVDRETTKQRDNHLLMLLDRERDRDRGGKGIIESLEQELERRRDLHPRNRSSDRSKTRLEPREESSNESDEGLRAEIEALRNDFKKLMGSASKSVNAVETKKTRRGIAAVSSGTLRSSGRQEPSADIRFAPGRTIDHEDSEDEDDGDDSASSSRKVFGNGGAETGQVLQVPLPT